MWKKMEEEDGGGKKWKKTEEKGGRGKRKVVKERGW